MTFQLALADRGHVGSEVFLETLHALLKGGIIRVHEELEIFTF